jgi:hypothetical protein
MKSILRWLTLKGVFCIFRHRWHDLIMDKPNRLYKQMCERCIKFR